MDESTLQKLEIGIGSRINTKETRKPSMDKFIDNNVATKTRYSVDDKAQSSGKKKSTESEDTSTGFDTGESGKKKRKRKEKKDGDTLKFMSENVAECMDEKACVDEKAFCSEKKISADSEENGPINDTGGRENKKRKKKEKDGCSLKSLSEIAADSLDEMAHSSGKKKPAESENTRTSIDTGECGKKKRKEKVKEDGDRLKFMSENATDSVDKKVHHSGKKKLANSEESGSVNETGESENKNRKKKEKAGDSLESLSETAVNIVDEKAHSLGKKKPAEYEEKSFGIDTGESGKKKRKKKEKKDGDILKSLAADSVDKKALGLGEKKSSDSQDKGTINDISESNKKKREKKHKTEPSNLKSLPTKAEKTNVGKEDEEAASSCKKSRRVKFSGDVEVFPPDDDSDVKMYDENNLVRGKRYTAEEDQLILDAVHKYIEVNNLGEEGLQMVLNCRRYPQVQNCWKEICSVLPWRPYCSVYGRAHTILERSEKRGFTEEENEIIRRHHGEFGPKWKKLAELMGKQRMHIKDAWRRIRLPNVKKGYWSQDEYQGLFDLVNLDLRLKAFDGRKTNNVMIRENISWEAISDKLSTRTMSSCCHKWYDQLTSPLVRQGLWADADDYRLLAALQKQDACNIEDVDWDSLLEKRSGEVCKQRWTEMVRHIGGHRERTFLQQVDVLCKRYCEDMVQYREEKNGLEKDDEESSESD